VAMAAAVRQYLTKLAKKGGQVKGACKRRGGKTRAERAAYYAELARRAAASRVARAKALVE